MNDEIPIGPSKETREDFIKRRKEELKISDTPRTDALRAKLTGNAFSTSDIYECLQNSESLERENQQLRDDLKQCAEIIKWLDENTNRCYPIEHNKRVTSALSLSSVQGALKRDLSNE